MAAVSSKSNGKGLGTAENTERNQWDFSIPATTEAQGHTAEQPIEQYANGYASNLTSPMRLDEIENSSGNGTPKSSRPKGKANPNYLSPYKQGLKIDYNGSRSGSEPDSLLDLYKQRNSIREKSIDSPMSSPRHLRGMSDARDAPREDKDDDSEQSRWIHKDKLAEIERREMEAAGIVPPPTRSKSKSRPAQSPEKIANGLSPQGEEALPTKEKKRRKVHSPSDREPEHESEPNVNFEREPDQKNHEEQTETNYFDIRTPEEIAADSNAEQTTSPVYRQQPSLRASSSRIPLPRSSPMPLPQEHIERSTPLPRKRGPSGDWDGEDSIVYNRSRSRGNSVGSQVLLDDIDTPAHGPESPRSPSSSSPSKARTSSASKHARKSSTSTPNSASKPRSTSATQNSNRSPSSTVTRPKSRSGLEPRPPTAINRPEGDAPWLKDMYKPDPMLPPEQQLIPTHAKRLQEEARRQEQWEQAQRDAEARKQARREELNSSREKEKQDEREFSPLAEYTTNGLQPTPGASRDDNGTSSLDTDQEHNQNRNSGSEWPLTRATTVTGRPPIDHINSGGGPGTGDKIGNAGYSAIPRMRPGNDGPQQHADSYRATVTSPAGGKSGQIKDPFEKERLERMEGEMAGEEGKGGSRKKDKSGGCCGCVVM